MAAMVVAEHAVPLRERPTVGSHIAIVVPSEFASTSTGASSGPSKTVVERHASSSRSEGEGAVDEGSAEPR